MKPLRVRQDPFRRGCAINDKLDSVKSRFTASLDDVLRQVVALGSQGDLSMALSVTLIGHRV